MKATDPMLLHLAQMASVRPPHIFHAFHTMKEQRARFNPAAYATFTGLELRHVERIVEAFTAAKIFEPSEAKPAQSVQGARLPADFTMPEDWLLWAQTQRSWTRDVAETEAASFIDYWHAQPGQKGVKLDWQGTWRNWVRRSHTPNGTPQGPAATPERQRESIEGTIRLYRRMGRHEEAEQLERSIHKSMHRN